MFYESLLLAALIALGFLLPLTILSALMGMVVPAALSWPGLFAILGAYFLWHWRRGQTLAMRTWKLELRSADGRMPSRRQLILRYLLAWPSVLSGIGIAWALFDRDRQFLHDRLAGTRIVFKG